MVLLTEPNQLDWTTRVQNTCRCCAEPSMSLCAWWYTVCCYCCHWQSACSVLQQCGKKNSWMSYKWNTSNNNVNVSMCHLQTHYCYQLLWLFHNQLLWFLLKTELQLKSDCSLSHGHLIIDYLIDDDTLQTYRPYRLNWTLHHVALRMTSLLQLSFVLNRRRNVQSVRDSL